MEADGVGGMAQPLNKHIPGWGARATTSELRAEALQPKVDGQCERNDHTSTSRTLWRLSSPKTANILSFLFLFSPLFDGLASLSARNLGCTDGSSSSDNQTDHERHLVRACYLS